MWTLLILIYYLYGDVFLVYNNTYCVFFVIGTTNRTRSSTFMQCIENTQPTQEHLRGHFNFTGLFVFNGGEW